MTIRLVGVLLCAAFTIATTTSVFAQSTVRKAGGQQQDFRNTTVKSSKSNTSDRATTERNGIGIYIVGAKTKRQTVPGKTNR